MKLDLGCGKHKQPGFIGMNRHAGEGVDVIGDLNGKLPFQDDSVEFVMAARSLPFVQDLNMVLSEIYRICMHKAVVCILAPYAHTYRHSSNPFLKHKFDEYTPRYLTRQFYQPQKGPPSPENPHYCHPDPPFDFRLLHMEMFYNAALWSPLYEQEDLETLHQLQINTVDEIMYHFLAVKNTITEEELEYLSRMTHAEPECVRELRYIAKEEM